MRAWLTAVLLAGCRLDPATGTGLDAGSTASSAGTAGATSGGAGPAGGAGTLGGDGGADAPPAGAGAGTAQVPGFNDDTAERALLPPCAELYAAEAVPRLGFHVFRSGTAVVFRAGEVFGETWGTGLRVVVLRIEQGRLRYVGYREVHRDEGAREARVELPADWLGDGALFYASYERRVTPLEVALGEALAWQDSALFRIDGDACQREHPPVAGAAQAGWIRIQHPQGFFNDHGVFSERLDEARWNAGHFMNVPRFLVRLLRDAAAEDLVFEVDFAFAPDEQRPPGDKPRAVTGVELSALEGREERAGGGSPRHALSAPCEQLDPDTFRCNLARNFAYGQVVDWELRVVPEGPLPTNLYSPFLYYAVGHGFTFEATDPRARGGGEVSVDAFGANPSERAAAFSQHASSASLDDVSAFVLEHGAMRAPIGEAVHAGRASCGSCHVNDGRSDVAFAVPGLGARLAPPLHGLGLLAEVDLDGRAGFGWQGLKPTVDDAVRGALALDFGVEDPAPELVTALAHYVGRVAVPQRDKSRLFDARVLAGEELFAGVGCASCHVECQQTRSGNVIRPYTDLLVHDLGDGAFRTAPLWALGRTAQVLGFGLDVAPEGMTEVRAALDPSLRGVPTLTLDQARFLHDGRALGLDAAIRAHGGEGASARAAYEALSDGERADLLAFLESL